MKRENDGLEIMENPMAEKVDQGEWADARKPQKLFTTGIGPCTGVLVHNPKERRAALGHFVDPRVDLEEFYSLVKFARREMGKVLDQVVYLSGVAPMDHGKKSRREAKEIRGFVTTAFLEMGYSRDQMHKLWNGLDEAATMAVDTESGKVAVNHYDYSHLNESVED